ncbi:hypothetical protein ADK35_23965 [Streptomyces viridochromogenes]|nr:hypothetical protein ADK35_23965 [Streptomyces viridochromogenes]
MQRIPFVVAEIARCGLFQERSRQTRTMAKPTGVHGSPEESSRGHRSVSISAYQFRCAGEELSEASVGGGSGLREPRISIEFLRVPAKVVFAERVRHVDHGGRRKQCPGGSKGIGASRHPLRGELHPVLGPEGPQNEQRPDFLIGEKLLKCGGHLLTVGPWAQIELGLVQPDDGAWSHSARTQRFQHCGGPVRCERMPQTPAVRQAGVHRLPRGSGLSCRRSADEHQQSAAVLGVYHCFAQLVVYTGALKVGREHVESQVWTARIDRRMNLECQGVLRREGLHGPSQGRSCRNPPHTPGLMPCVPQPTRKQGNADGVFQPSRGIRCQQAMPPVRTKHSQVIKSVGQVMSADYADNALTAEDSGARHAFPR